TVGVFSAAVQLQPHLCPGRQDGPEVCGRLSPERGAHGSTLTRFGSIDADEPDGPRPDVRRHDYRVAVEYRRYRHGPENLSDGRELRTGECELQQRDEEQTRGDGALHLVSLGRTGRTRGAKPRLTPRRLQIEP